MQKIPFPQSGMSVTGRETGVTYSFGKIINEGGFGKLYSGSDNFGNAVAIKVFKPANRQFVEVQKDWKNEIDILNIVKHPSIIYAYDYFIWKNLFYIILERAKSDLYEFIQSNGTLSELSVFETARQLLFGLHYLHINNIIHKDLTVYNVLYFDENKFGRSLFKISDFGISEDLYGKNSFSTNQRVHRSFKAPEILRSGYTSFQSDLYHLGMVLYFCLTGDFPYNINAPDAEINSAIIAGIPRQKAEQLGTSLGDFISILLRRSREYRFENAIGACNYLLSKVKVSEIA